MALLVSVGCGKGPIVPLPVGTKRVVTPPPAVRPPVTVEAESRPEEPDPKTTPLVAEIPPSEGEPPKKAAEPTEGPSVLHADPFADLKGSIHLNRNGVKTSEGAHQRTIYFFAATPEGGTYTLQAGEDATTAGPDGEPGVLALSWQEVPPMLAWSGFVYLGGTGSERGLKLPELKQARTADDLAKLRVKFRYRGTNPNSDMPAKVTIGCRLEPSLADSFNKRLDLGTITAGEEWGEFEMVLSVAKNQPAFLRAVADENPPDFKIVFAQEGPISGYRAGDTVLIDDISIARE